MNWRRILNAIGILLIVGHVMMLVTQWPTTSLTRHFVLLGFAGLIGFDRLSDPQRSYALRRDYWEDATMLLLLGVAIALSVWLELWRPLSLAVGMACIVIGSIPRFQPAASKLGRATHV
ncbi:hypothetical protein A3B32_01810 [Candidatus Uhrbacteria bacterium RIFCSPLOWO2_01_FULL_53_9]|uniref:Uncharacterized protein n=3 Tax=Candidatus Uhriibacteriota TaxID=1752732 RepID=A0A1F7UYX0_9BACT|nr:MAG: hypothetical protein A3C17_00295 [Candidatus Uhrbacteria bacterium RIFCSPHIGHO2_02_FULL_53_13]OGL83443.1 MAG: hypothetical protein A3B32_01810 [Candidatus Uhrbacteria bacterium RIFCSPLOWO2_01_FULL_53_9]OGL90145.1 MAG: hypothetical protein A3I45_00395 [Candidatus Uhrbacteria bacterium RIFCSPLOWO2_02_FULL_53_10]